MLACLAAAAGCEADPEAPPLAHHTRDSAGITIAVNSGAPAAAERWSVDAEPVVSTGGSDGPPATMFTVVTSATRLSDGTIVVLENETSELRFFDPGGAHLRTAGGFGEGPGESLSVRLGRVAHLDRIGRIAPGGGDCPEPRVFGVAHVQLHRLSRAGAMEPGRAR